MNPKRPANRVRTLLDRLLSKGDRGCCANRPDEYRFGPDRVPDLMERLKELSREQPRPGLVIRRYVCSVCGQRWAYSQEVVGHRDVEERLYKEPPSAKKCCEARLDEYPGSVSDNPELRDILIEKSHEQRTPSISIRHYECGVCDQRWLDVRKRGENGIVSEIVVKET